MSESLFESTVAHGRDEMNSDSDWCGLQRKKNGHYIKCQLRGLFYRLVCKVKNENGNGLTYMK